MNSVSFSRQGAEAGAAFSPGAAHEGILEIPGPFDLHHGGRLEAARIAWRLTGDESLPVIVALGGISAHRRVFDAAEPRRGWWGEVAGAGLPLDSERCRILGFDFLGGSGDSSKPTAGHPFPSLSSFDQAEALRRLLDDLGLARLRAIVGASYGGMVALAFAERYASRVEQLIVVSASDRPHPMATAWRSIQRRIVRLMLQSGSASDGLALARALAMATYRSPEEFSARFDYHPQRGADGFTFPVEDYLLARGRAYAADHLPESFLCLSESIDLHVVDATKIVVPTTMVGVREDQLVPIGDIRALAARLPQARMHEMSSPHGHDAFLKESGQLRPIFKVLYGELE